MNLIKRSSCLLALFLSFSVFAQSAEYRSFPSYMSPSSGSYYYTVPDVPYYNAHYEPPYSTNRTIIYPTTTSTTYWYNGRPYNYNRYYHQAGNGCMMVNGSLVCY